LLQSALARAQSRYHEDLIQEGAAVWESLAQNHPFFDGNKRTAFAVMVTFLAINGLNLKAEPDEVILFVDSLYESGTFTFEDLETWLRTHTEPRS